MAGALNRNMFRRQMEEGLNSVFGLNYKKHSPEWSMVFPTFKANKARMEDVLVSGFAGAAAKAEGASFQYDTAQELWTARYVMTTYALGFFITEEAIEDGLYGNLGSKYAAALARSMQYTKELEAAAVFNNGFDTNYPGGDGQPLFSTAHSTVAAGDQANTFSTQADISETALEQAYIQIDDMDDDRGLPIMARAKKLIFPTASQYDVERLFGSTLRPGTADNDINALPNVTGKPQFCKMHLLADVDFWALQTDIEDGLKHFQRIKLQRGTQGDFETGNMRYKARERYAFGWTDWRAVFGSSGI